MAEQFSSTSVPRNPTGAHVLIRLVAAPSTDTGRPIFGRASDYSRTPYHCLRRAVYGKTSHHPRVSAKARLIGRLCSCRDLDCHHHDRGRRCLACGCCEKQEGARPAASQAQTRPQQLCDNRPRLIGRLSCHIDATLFVMAHAPASPRLSIDPQDARGEGQPAAGFFDHAVGFGRGPVAEEQHPHVVAAEP